MRRAAPWPANLGVLHLPYVATDAIAFVDRTGPGREAVTYRAFDARCARVAGGLREAGVGFGDRVGVLGDNSVGWAAAFFGALRLGAVVVPLNPRLPDETLRSIAADATLAAVLAEPAMRERVPGTLPLEPPGDPLPFADVDRRDPAVILYTSGSTGGPKGVVCSHGSQVVAVQGWVGWETTRTMDRTLVAAPLCHKNGLGETKVALAVGATVVLQGRFDPRAYLEAAAEERCTTLSGVPTMFARMLAQDDLLAALDLSTVAGLNVGSAPFGEALADRVREVFPHAHVFNSYGTTEAPAVFGDDPDGRPAPRTSVGKPLGSVEVRLVDSDGEDANPGELWVRGEGVMDGYLGRPEDTAAKLVDGFVRTGDVLRRDDDGWFHFVGRIDDMFVVAGENVYPGAVAQLLEQHPGVRQAAVVPVPDDERGHVPVAFVVPVPGAGVTEEDLRSWTLAHGLAAAHPRSVWFVEALPLGPTEKVDVRALGAEAARRRDRPA
ncbi:MAG TPA: class I adenylate-forming enzyme family protein [Actinomycetota bacterium]